MKLASRFVRRVVLHCSAIKPSMKIRSCHFQSQGKQVFQLSTARAHLIGWPSRRQILTVCIPCCGYRSPAATPFGNTFSEPLDVCCCELHRDCARVFFEIAAPFGAGNGNDVAAARQHPGERDMRWLAMLLRGELLHFAYEIEIARKVLLRKARRPAAKIVCGQVLRVLDATGEKSAP